MAAPVSAASSRRLAALEDRVRRELELTGYAPRTWIPGDDDVLEVLVVGGGQAGLTTAFGLARRRVPRVLVVDAAAPGQEGPWSGYARMHTLRTPKALKGPDLGVPSLSPHAWFEARYGTRVWDEITFIPRLDWQDYLGWYRRVLDLPVENGTEVVAVHRPTTPDGPFTAELRHDGTVRTVAARRIVFATGLDGAGRWNAPAGLFGDLPKRFWAHTCEDIDFAALAGKRVGVLGGGASAFDNAGCALEAGAASVDSFMRRPKMPTSNPLRWMEFAGFVEHFADWPDDRKWAFTLRALEVDQPATQNSLWRCFAHPNFSLSFASPWLSTRVDGDEVVVDVAGTERRFDYLIAGTGVAVDLSLRPELAEFVDDIALWGDRYTPPAGRENAGLSRYPYLRGDFAFTPRDEAAAPWISRLYHFAQGSRVSMGITGHQLSGLPAGVDRLTWGITRDAFCEHGAEILDEFFAYDVPELVNIGPQPAGTPAIQTADRATPDDEPEDGAPGTGVNGAGMNGATNGVPVNGAPTDLSAVRGAARS